MCSEKIVGAAENSGQSEQTLIAMRNPKALFTLVTNASEAC